MSLTPAVFSREINRLCDNVGDYHALKSAGAHLIAQVFGENANAYEAGLDRLFARLRELHLQERRRAGVRTRVEASPL